MNLSDILIIYLACGLPFAFSYLLNHQQLGLKAVLIRSAVYAISWPVIGAYKIKRLILKNVLSGQNSTDVIDLDSSIDKKVDELCNQLKSAAFEISNSPSIEFRDVLNHYVGLSRMPIDGKIDNRSVAAELLEKINHSNPDLGNICTNRRNRERLRFHRTIARNDFLNTLQFLLKSSTDQSRLIFLAQNLAAELNDSEAVHRLKEMFPSSRQNQHETIAKHLAKDAWPQQDITRLNQI